MPDVVEVRLSQLAAQSPADVAAGAKLWTLRGHLLGLPLEWVGPNALRVGTGSTEISSLGYAIEVVNPINKASLTLTASSWSHLYLFVAANGTPDVEISATAPSTPYSGAARTKTGDPSRRYLGSVKTNSSGALYNFLHTGNEILYRNKQDEGGVFRVLTNGVETAETSVSLAAAVPVTARAANVRVINTTTTTAALYTGTADDSAAGPPTSGIVAISPGKDAFPRHPLSSAQTMTYWYSANPGTAGAYIDVYGYILER